MRLTTEYQDLPKGTERTILLEYDGAHFEVVFVDSHGKTIDVLTTPTDGLEIVKSA